MNDVIKFPHKPVRDDELPNVPAEDMDTMRRLHEICEQLHFQDGAEYCINRIAYRDGKRIGCGVATQGFDREAGAAINDRPASALVVRDGEKYTEVNEDDPKDAG